MTGKAPRPRGVTAVGQFVLCVVVAATVAGCGGRQRMSLPRRGEVVDEVLARPDGSTVSLVDLHGKPVVIHFFAMGSLAAEADVGLLKELDPKRVSVLGIGVDQDSPELYVAWQTSLQVTYPVLVRTPEIVQGTSDFGVLEVVPTTIVLDADGREAWRRAGPLDRETLAQVLSALEGE